MRFADTSFWIGLQVARDHRHVDATRLWQQDQSPVRTSNLVLGETWTWLRRRAGHSAAVRFLDQVGQSNRVSVAVVDDAIDERAWAWLRLRDERTYSYVDATSFEIMRRERINEALAFDGDFTAAGTTESLRLAWLYRGGPNLDPDRWHQYWHPPATPTEPTNPARRWDSGCRRVGFTDRSKVVEPRRFR